MSIRAIKPFQNQKGLTLIELMISMTIALIVVAAVLTMYVSMANSNIDYLKMIRLNNEMRAAMNTIARDLRRAGHNQNAASLMGTGASGALALNDFANTTDTSIRTNTAEGVASNIITFSYDKDSTDSATDIDGYGYRLNAGAIEYCDEDNAVCDPSISATWEDLTDEQVINISDLTFIVNTYNVASVAVQLKEVEISMTGELISDTDFTRTLTETVTVRNEVIP